MTETTNKERRAVGGRPPRYGEATKPVRVPLSVLPVVQAFSEGRPPPGYVEQEPVQKAAGLFLAGHRKARPGAPPPDEWGRAEAIIRELAESGEQSPASAAGYGAQRPELLEICRAAAHSENPRSLSIRAKRVLKELGERR